MKKSPWGNLLLSILTALCALPLLVSSLYLASAVASRPEIIDMPPVEIVSLLNSYYFFWSLLFVFPAFLVLRLIAARVYAAAGWTLAGQGLYQHSALSKLIEIHPPVIRGCASKWWQRCWKVAFFSMAYAVLIVFSTIPLVSQFFAAKPPGLRWLSHPMVQLPLYRHIPKPLGKAAASIHGHEQGGFIAWLDDEE